MEWHYILYMVVGIIIYHVHTMFAYFFGSIEASLEKQGRIESIMKTPNERVNTSQIIEDCVIPLEGFRRLEVE